MLLPKRAVNVTSTTYKITLKMIISNPTSGSTKMTVKRPRMNSSTTAVRERRLFLTVGLSTVCGGFAALNNSLPIKRWQTAPISIVG